MRRNILLLVTFHYKTIYILLFWHAPLDISLHRGRFWARSTASFSSLILRSVGQKDRWEVCISVKLHNFLFHLVRSSMPKDLCFTSVAFFFIYLFSLLALSSQNQRMDGAWVCYKQFNFGVILVSH